ncbi:MAG: hypothetical protein V4539_05365 [Bacteroidota bacterium]
MRSIIVNIQRTYRKIDWQLLLFLVLVLDVKLFVKLAALLLLTVINRRRISVQGVFKQRYLWFYFGMIVIGFINVLLQYKYLTLFYVLVATLGTLFWILCAVAAFHAFGIIQNGSLVKKYYTVGFFFLLHISIILFNFLSIIIETGSINPYKYKGLNNKYFVSTGDSLKGITFDSPVTTAMICAFGILFFLYRRRFFYSFLCMLALLLLASNLTNIFLVCVCVFIFIFHSDRIQKSILVIFSGMLIIFNVVVSPDNNEHIFSFLYKLVGKAYYLPKVKVLTNDELKQQPDSLLTIKERRIKTALIYIDSVNSVETRAKVIRDQKNNAVVLQDKPKDKDSAFYEYRPSVEVKGKENRFSILLKELYPEAKKDSLAKLFDWERSGKLIAYKELFSFLKDHKDKIWLGTGIGNFSSRVAFKATALDIAGSYPAKYQYIHPDFMDNHFYIYLHYHSQWQFEHTAANTPDSTYSEILGEYGIAGILLFVIFYCGYFLRRLRYLTYGIPLFFLMLMGLSVEYWFEQLSIIILFELLMVLDIRSLTERRQLT